MATKIAVIGGGSWATAIVKMLCNNSSEIHWWIRNEAVIDHLKKFKHNPNYLTSVEFDTNKLVLNSNLQEVVKNSDVLIMAVPSAFLKEALSDLSASDFKNKQVFSAIKGIVPEHNLIVGEFFNKEFQIPIENIGVVTGPCHAEEVAMEKLSYLTIASQNVDSAKFLATQLNCRYIKTFFKTAEYSVPYMSSDTFVFIYLQFN